MIIAQQRQIGDGCYYLHRQPMVASSIVSGFGWSFKVQANGGRIQFRVGCYADRHYDYVVDWTFSVMSTDGALSNQIQMPAACRAS